MDGLKRARANIKASLTRLQAQVNTLKENPDTILEEYESRLVRVSELFVLFEDNQAKIENLIGDEEEEQLQAEYGYREDIESKYFSIKSQIQSIISSRNSTRDGRRSESPTISETLDSLTRSQVQLANIMRELTSSSSNNTSASNNVPGPKIPLPVVQLPAFNGEYKDWVPFFDMFQSLVHNNASLSAVQKLQYLKQSLQGEAASVLKHLPISEANYETAYQLLKKKYEKEDYIIEAHLRTLLEHHSLKQASAKNLRSLTNTFEETIRALTALQLPTEHWDCWINFLLISKLDKDTQQLWRREAAAVKRPKFEILLQFLENRIYELTTVPNAPSRDTNDSSQRNNNQHRIRMSHTTSVVSCINCKGNHYIQSCPVFHKRSSADKYKFITSQGLCFNCLKGKHLVRDCNSTFRCQKCGRRHHTILHDIFSSSSNNTGGDLQSVNLTSSPTVNKEVTPALAVTSETSTKPDDINKMIAARSYTVASSPESVGVGILPTAIVYIKDSANNLQPCKVLFDTGSQITLISESCAQRLGIKRFNARLIVTGIGGFVSPQTTRGKSTIELFSKDGLRSCKITAYILSKLTNDLPSLSVTPEITQWFDTLQDLADPNLGSPSRIDLLLGCDVVFDILSAKRIPYKSSKLYACNTIFGWVICGKMGSTENLSCLASTVDIDRSLKRFWELEEPIVEVPRTAHNEECERHFLQTHTRLDTGQYMVHLPFITTAPELGDSATGALKRLNTMERRFNKDSELLTHYQEFMKTYLAADHMSLMLECSTRDGYFLPHHGVWKRSSSSTKLRVVFDGSAPSTTGVSLNEILHIGEKIHNNVYDILLRFRLGKIGYIADIQKMFRQILVHPADRRYQRIYWRETADNPPKIYELNTVTYGTACAPFLALRTLQQLANDECESHPLGAKILKDSFYVDDLMKSDDTLEEARDNVKDIIEILQKGHLPLHKWASNCKELLVDIPKELCEGEKAFTETDDVVVKTLGLNWHSREDEFSFTIHTIERLTFTKRSILSIISKIFDPLGLLSPYVILTKLFMQHLWLINIPWDDVLPSCLSTQWTEIYTQLPIVKNVRVPRWIFTRKNSLVQLHGFADASERAFAAVIYLRVLLGAEIKVHILTSKSKVAPIKQVSIARLELCAALLLARLFRQVRNALKFCQQQLQCVAWTDSTTVLAWLNDHPRRWSTFIGNRTAKILEILPYEKWRHVGSEHNPADLASRGLLPSNLLPSSLWWFGPEFLQQEEFDNLENQEFHTEEERKKNCFMIRNEDAAGPNPLDKILNKFSTMTLTLRVTAWWLVYVRKCKLKADKIKINSINHLTTDDLQDALNLHIKRQQQKTFGIEICKIKRNENLTKKNKLWTLDPFLDDKGILRVGGRLQHAMNIPFEQRHPTILHKNDRLSELLVYYYHKKFLHGTGQLLETNIKLKYWIIGVKYLIKRITRKCTVCIRYRAERCTQKMASMPEYRFQVSKAFLNTGVDYAGPLTALTRRGRGAKQVKCYIALFVCLSTKALHLELVMDLSTDSFLAAFKRFLSRRGKVHTMYSDNGTNFQGAFRCIKEVNHYFANPTKRDIIHHFLAENGIRWKFIPPSAPHFGGIWEAGVKSVKYHLRRVMGNAHLTYDEFNTLLCQIENCLNSRPLTSISNDKDDFRVLTPNHFLTGDSMMPAPEIPIENDCKHLRTRWQHVQRLQQDFWKIWQRQYLSTLKQRYKWTQKQSDLRVGDLVLIAEQNQLPGDWLLGRVEQIHPGKDNLVRVVTIRTKNGITKRPIVKLIKLLQNEESSEQ